MRLFWLMLFFVSVSTGLAQGSESDYEKNTNVGMKLGASVCSMYGGELKNPTPLLGYVAGFYIHNRLDKKKLHYQTGLDLRLRGSNFDNAKLGDTAINRAYTRIGIVSVDLPLLMLFSVGDYKRNNFDHLMVGGQVGYMIRTMAYVGPNQIPANSQVYNSTWQNLPLNPWEFSAVIGYQHKQEEFGYQISAKIGLNNLNQNFKLEGMAPATGSGRNIGTYALEFALVF